MIHSRRDAPASRRAFGAGVRTDFIRGMGKVSGGFVILLDVARVLGTDGLMLLADPVEALAKAAALSAPNPSE